LCSTRQIASGAIRKGIQINARRGQPVRRKVQTVPNLGPVEQMKADAIAQLEARVAIQKELYKKTHKSEAEEVDEMWKWVKISILVAFPVCVLSVFKDLVAGEHHHRKPDPLPDYMRIRNKPFPWECEDCELFNRKCWKECKAAKQS